MASLTLADLRHAVDATWQETLGWCVRKERIFDLPRPEQQVLFELGTRLRDTLRRRAGLGSWDRLFFNAAAASAGAEDQLESAPIYIDPRQLCAGQEAASACIDIVVSVEVLRGCDPVVEFDPNGQPRHQRWVPRSLLSQGRVVDSRARAFEHLSEARCEGFLFVLYSNRSGRQTSVDTRQVVSWATWRQAGPTLFWASRHFRARDAAPSSPVVLRL